MESRLAPTLDVHLAALVQEAVGRVGTPVEVARSAAEQTRRALGGSCLDGCGVHRRAEAYFWKIVRRAALQSGTSDAGARFILTSLVDDLCRAGRDSQDIWREIERGWSTRIPSAVLEEYRMRLCA